jgi:sugar lactone lactonase YvrE
MNLFYVLKKPAETATANINYWPALSTWSPSSSFEQLHVDNKRTYKRWHASSHSSKNSFDRLKPAADTFIQNAIAEPASFDCAINPFPIMKNYYPTHTLTINASSSINPQVMKKVLFTLITFVAVLFLSSRLSVAQCTPEGDPNIFGDHVWNVYAWNAGEASDIGTSWNTNYSGYYVDTSLNFNTQSRWDDEASPSDASGYLGCPVAIENHSFSAKRAGFTCGYYHIDIPGHDDEAELYVDGVLEWQHVGCCDGHAGVWTGWLTEASTIEFRVTEGGGGSYGSLNILPVKILSASSYTFNCYTSSIILTTNVPSPVWSTGATTPSITVTSPGNYNVTYDAGAGCAITSSVTIANATATTADLTGPLCHSPTSMLSGSVSGNIASIKWKLDGTTVSTSMPVWGNKTIVAGNNGGGSGANQLNSPFAIAIDGGGNMYIADNANGRIMKWDAGASSGTVYASGLSYPQRLFLDKYNNLYVSEYGDATVLKFAPGSTTGVVVAGGNGYGSAANQLSQGTGIFVDDAGNVYVSDGNNARIQKWAPGATSGITVAGGNGQGNTSNQFNSGYGLQIDAAGNMYFCDPTNHRVQKWASGATSATTVAGGNGQGNATDGKLNFPVDLWIDGNGNMIILDGERLVFWAEGATKGIMLTNTSYPDLWIVTGFGVGPSGSLYLTASLSNDVVKFDIVTPPSTSFQPSQGGTYEMLVTDFFGCTASDSHVLGATPKVNGKLDGLFCGGSPVTLTATGGSGYTWNPGNLSGAVQTVSPATTSTYTVIASNGCSTTTTVEVNNLSTGSACFGSNYLLSSELQPAQLVWNVNGSQANTTTANWNQEGSYVVQNNNSPNAGFSSALGLTGDAQGNIYVCDAYNHRVMKWAPGATAGVVVAGGSSGSGASQLNYPGAIFIDNENNLYVCDVSNYRVQKFSNGSNIGITVAGGNFNGSNNNQFSSANGVYVDENMNVYVSDATNHRVMKWGPGASTGIVVAGGNGQGSAANQLNYPAAVTVDAAGNLYVVDASNRRVQKWAPGATSGVTVAGTGNYGSQLENLMTPSGIYRDAAGNLYISDYGNKGIRVWTPGATQAKEPLQLPSPLGGCSNIYLDKSGNIYVAGYPSYPYNNYFVVKFTINGFENYAPSSLGDFSVTVTSFNGCTATSASASIQPSPYIVQGSAVNSCSETGVTLTAAGTQNYVWTPGNLAGPTQTFVPSVNTVYTVTDDNNCTASATATVFTSRKSPSAEIVVHSIP